MRCTGTFALWKNEAHCEAASSRLSHAKHSTDSDEMSRFDKVCLGTPEILYFIALSSYTEWSRGMYPMLLQGRATCDVQLVEATWRGMGG